MNETAATVRLTRDKFTRGASLGVLVLLGAAALAGPSGVLAWGENLSLLDQRQAEIVQLEVRRDELRNRVALLNPQHADSDLVGELLRSHLNVTHPDEVVIVLEP